MGKKLMLPDIRPLFQLHRLWSTGYEILGSPKILTDGGIFETLLLTFLQAVNYMPLKTAKFSYLWCFPNVFFFPTCMVLVFSMPLCSMSSDEHCKANRLSNRHGFSSVIWRRTTTNIVHSLRFFFWDLIQRFCRQHHYGRVGDVNQTSLQKWGKWYRTY